MKIAILSDIHSNKYALEAVLGEAKKESILKFFILGDIFGYYPWAEETYQMLESLDIICVKGNHDALLLQGSVFGVAPVYLQAAKDNEHALRHRAPQALEWLNKLLFEITFAYEGRHFHLVHGHPGNPAEGRYYPDNQETYSWFPCRNEVLLMGHTHYPFEKNILKGGKIINPGSVGQPRDGDVRSSWCILDTESLHVDWRRTAYGLEEAMVALEAMSWEPKFIAMLAKNYQGPMK